MDESSGGKVFRLSSSKRYLSGGWISYFFVKRNHLYIGHNVSRLKFIWCCLEKPISDFAPTLQNAETTFILQFSHIIAMPKGEPVLPTMSYKKHDEKC